MGLRPFPVEGFILAGGKSSRMGRDKALLSLAGEPILLRTAELMRPLVRRVAVIGPRERYEALGLNCIPDDLPACGPLGGISTLLRVTATDWNLVISCDLPFLTRDWLLFLIQRGMDSEAGVVFPVSDFGQEPLCAMYHKRCTEAVAGALSRGVRKISDALHDITIELLSRKIWRRFDPDGLLLKNMNGPEDYAEAQRRFGGWAAH